MYYKNPHNQQLTKTLLAALPNFKAVLALQLKFVRYTINSIAIELISKNTGAKQFQRLLIISLEQNFNDWAHCPHSALESRLKWLCHWNNNASQARSYIKRSYVMLHSGSNRYTMHEPSTICYKKFPSGHLSTSAEKQIGEPRQKRITSLTVWHRKETFKAIVKQLAKKIN